MWSFATFFREPSITTQEVWLNSSGSGDSGGADFRRLWKENVSKEKIFFFLNMFEFCVVSVSFVICAIRLMCQMLWFSAEDSVSKVPWSRSSRVHIAVMVPHFCVKSCETRNSSNRRTFSRPKLSESESSGVFVLERAHRSRSEFC